MQAFHLQFSEGSLFFLPRNFRDIVSPEKLICCLNVRNAFIWVQGAVQQIQLRCVCWRGFLTFRKVPAAVHSAAFYSARSSEAVIQLWQNRSAQVPHVMLLGLHPLHTTIYLSVMCPAQLVETWAAFTLWTFPGCTRTVTGCTHPTCKSQGSLWRRPLDAHLKEIYVKATGVSTWHLLTRKR